MGFLKLKMEKRYFVLHIKQRLLGVASSRHYQALKRKSHEELMAVADSVTFTAKQTHVVAVFAAVLRQHVVDWLCCTFKPSSWTHTRYLLSINLLHGSKYFSR